MQNVARSASHACTRLTSSHAACMHACMHALHLHLHIPYAGPCPHEPAHAHLCACLCPLQKWYTIYKDHITLADYEVHDGMNLELYYN